MRVVRAFFIACVFLISSISVKAQGCLINASSTRGCVPHPISFTANFNDSKTVQSYSWDFGDNTSSTEAQPVHVYQIQGTFQVKLTITFADGSECEKEYPANIIIYDQPTASLNLKPLYERCWQDRFLLLSENSTKGADSAEIINYTWDLGDGDTSRRKNPSHFYETNGEYDVKLEITDENGCKDTTSVKIESKVYPKLKPNFDKYGQDSCPITEIIFVNRTDSFGWDINFISWRFGNGDSLTANKSDANWSQVWRRVTTRYTGNNSYQPELYVRNKLGCVAKFQRYSIENIFFKFDATVSPQELCFDQKGRGPRVIFNQPPIANARSFVWDFGEPTIQDATNTTSWSPMYTYSEPGRFSVNLKVTVRGCQRDTTYCDMVVVNGPQAKINDDSREYNDFRRSGFPYRATEFPKYFDSCRTDSVVYFTVDTISEPGFRNIYCDATKRDSEAVRLTTPGCNFVTRYKYELNPSRQISIMKQKIVRTRNVWKPGDALPSGPVFKKDRGQHKPRNLHDTDRFAPACQPPHTVEFINNSIKYRGYSAIDNFPGLYPDSCLNPSTPWASDSLEYFWDFDEGASDTSTEISPNEYARFSTERLPVHTFLRKGCFKVKLEVFDPETGCKSWDSVRITVQEPDAGWDTSAYPNVSRMHYLKQKEFEDSNYRVGARLKGLECTGYTQTVDLSENLPSCEIEQYWVVFDSAAQSYFSVCGKDTIVQYAWTPSQKLQNTSMLYAYESEGWKTMGVVIKSGDCFDTMWYHNYKYFHDINALHEPSHYHVCPGDSVTSELLDQTQEAISQVWFDLSYQRYWHSVPKPVASDSLPYVFYRAHGELWKVLSSLKNYDYGMVDDTLINLLDKKASFRLDKPGHYLITANALHRLGCQDDDVVEVSVGHYSNFETDRQTVCIGDTVRFLDTVRYFQEFAFSPEGLGYDTTNFWADPVGRRFGDTPRFAERIHWDFNNDGIIDDSSSRPIVVFDTPGVYSVAMYTQDSFGCEWQKFVREDYITVRSVKADFSLVGEDSIRFCAPQIFVFKDETTIKDSTAYQGRNIRFWEWKWGNGDQVLKSRLDKGTTGHLYRHNGEYTVFLKVYLDTYFETGGAGCIDSVERKVYVEGPKPRFSLAGAAEGCVPFKTTVKDSSDRVSVYEWQLGDGRTKPSYGEELVDLSYFEPGTYCISLQGGDSVVDFNGDTLYCVDEYPFKNCEIQVTVWPKDELLLSHDSLICINKFANFDFSESDNQYQEFELSFDDFADTLRTSATAERAFDSLGSFRFMYTGSGARCPDTAYSHLDVIGIQSKFSIDSSRLDTPTFYFKNKSLEAERFEWILEEEIWPVSSTEDFIYTFSSTGEKEICLVAFNAKNCPDTFCQSIEIRKDIWIPNVYTPNLDGVNDRFKIRIKGQQLYDLVIFNRWGEKVFESNSFNYLWNGKVFNELSPCPAGTYFYVFRYQLIGESEKTVKGTVTLLR